MSCSAQFWIFGLSSLIVGGIASYLLMRNRVQQLLDRISGDADKIISLENNYSSLRSSSQEQILALKDEKQELAKHSPLTNDLVKTHEKLQVEYNSIKSELLELRQNSKTQIPLSKTIKSKDTKSEKIISDLKVKNESLKKSLKSLNKNQKEYSDQNKTIKKLKKEIKSLKEEIKKGKDSQAIEKKVEITKSLKTKKLKDWLNRENSYKVKKKVSTRKINGNS